MPKVLNRALTEARIRAACAAARPGKPQRLNDGGGLMLYIRGERREWLLREQRGGAERVTVLGSLAAMTLASARKAAESARAAARAAPPPVPRGPTFGAVFEAWMRKRRSELTAAYADDVYERIAHNVPPDWEQRPVRSITRRDVLDQLERIAARGAHEQARRVRALLEQVFDYAIVRQDLDDNPAGKSLLRALPAKPKGPRSGHTAAPVVQMPAVYKAVEAYPSPAVSLALRFTILTAARTGEVLGARWNEVDAAAAAWTVPAARMKAAREHVVPLSEQALAVLAAARLLRTSTADDALVFPSPRGGGRPLSNMAMLAAVKAMGFSHTVHGFRATFSTWANDGRVAEPDVIEAALAHTVPGVRGAYDRGDRLAARRRLMNAWAAFVTAQCPR